MPCASDAEPRIVFVVRFKHSGRVQSVSSTQTTLSAFSRFSILSIATILRFSQIEEELSTDFTIDRHLTSFTTCATSSAVATITTGLARLSSRSGYQVLGAIRSPTIHCAQTEWNGVEILIDLVLGGQLAVFSILTILPRLPVASVLSVGAFSTASGNAQRFLAVKYVAYDLDVPGVFPVFAIDPIVTAKSRTDAIFSFG